jgi:hypothetical protein
VAVAYGLFKFFDLSKYGFKQLLSSQLIMIIGMFNIPLYLSMSVGFHPTTETPEIPILFFLAFNALPLSLCVTNL